MALQFIGVDPDTPNTGSPTVWIDPVRRELVLQGWREIDAAMMEEIRATGPIPNHETVLRLPDRMIPILRKALDELDGGQQ